MSERDEVPRTSDNAAVRATLIESRLAHEFNLAGQRMTWLVTSQAFLFAAWVQLVRPDPPKFPFPFPPVRHVPPNAGLLLTLIPVVGLVVSMAAAVAISAALRMTDHLVVDRAEVDWVLGLSRMSPLRQSWWTRYAGHIPPGVLPLLFITSWSIVLIRERVDSSCLTNERLLKIGAAAGGVALMFWAAAIVLRLRKAVRTAERKEKDARANFALAAFRSSRDPGPRGRS